MKKQLISKTEAKVFIGFLLMFVVGNLLGAIAIIIKGISS